MTSATPHQPLCPARPRRLRRSLAAIALLLTAALALPCGAADGQPPDPASIAAITRQLQAPQLVGGAFVQTRALHGLAHPLQASGRFVFWRERGLYWETQQPFYQATTFTSAEVINWPEPSGPPQPKGPEDPLQQHITAILLAVFSADLRRIEGLFDSHWQIRGDAWTLTLAPASKAVQRIIDHATLSGEKHLRTLTVATRAGDVNTMEFREVTALANLPQPICLRFSRQPDPSCPPVTATPE